MQPDSYIQNPYDPQTLNRYSYVRNNPLKYVDPSGNFFMASLAVAFAIGVTALAVVGFGMLAGSMSYVTSNHARGKEITSEGVVNAAMDGANDATETAVTTCAVVAAGAIAGAAIPGKIGQTISKISGADELMGSTSPSTYSKILKQYNKGSNPSSGTTVLGRGSDYIVKGQEMGANYLKIDAKTWNSLEQSGNAWKVNQQFLDDAIARGDEFVLATSEANAGQGFYAKELAYLKDKGYKVVGDKLIKGTEKWA